MKKAQSDSGFLTNEQIADQLEAITGLRPPASYGANWRTEFAASEVTSRFMFWLKHSDDVIEASRLAVASLFEASASKIEDLIPHIERALGRSLTSAEREAGALAA